MLLFELGLWRIAAVLLVGLEASVLLASSSWNLNVWEQEGAMRSRSHVWAQECVDSTWGITLPDCVMMTRQLFDAHPQTQCVLWIGCCITSVYKRKC